MGSKYQKRHYEDVAEILKAHLDSTRKDGYHHKTMDSIVREFSLMFEDDNPLFDRERFLEACGLEQGD